MTVFPFSRPLRGLNHIRPGSQRWSAGLLSFVGFADFCGKALLEEQKDLVL